MKINRVGVDLAKNVFQLHGADHKGKAVWKRQLPRSKWIKILCETVKPGTEIGMEACAGAHHWARLLTHRGYAVKIIPPQFVKPFVKNNKNDANDAQAICEAMGRPNMHPVKVKTVAQQDIQPVPGNRRYFCCCPYLKHRFNGPKRPVGEAFNSLSL